MGSPSDRRGRRMLVKLFRWWRWDCSALEIVRYLKMSDIKEKCMERKAGILQWSPWRVQSPAVGEGGITAVVVGQAPVIV